MNFSRNKKIQENSQNLKALVRDHWDRDVCGTRYGRDVQGHTDLEKISHERYRLEPYIPEFADFASARGKKILEIGVGAGVDFANWIEHGAQATGIDLTQAAVDATRQRLETLGYIEERYELKTGDAEQLAFGDETFDWVYSYGVLHHSPDTLKAFQEVHRVLRKNGTFKGMVYHVPSVTGWILWLRYAFCTGKWFKSPRQVIYENVESPGTKAYTVEEMKEMLEKAGFTDIRIETRLVFGDLLLNKPSAKYQSPIYRLIWKCYPRWVIRLFGDRYGFFMFLQARKTNSGE